MRACVEAILCVAIARAGYVQDILDILQDSEAVLALEPLIVGLQLTLGQPVRVAQEIREVAQDIVDRIGAASATSDPPEGPGRQVGAA